MKTQPNSQSGFTFLEVLVAISILSFGILGLISTVHSVNLNQSNADGTTEATMIASDQIERIKQVAMNEPLGGSYGFSYFLDDTSGFLVGYDDSSDVTRYLSETVNGFTRETTVTVYPDAAQSTEDFKAPDRIHMVDVQVDVSWTNAAGATKHTALNTVLQRRQFVQ